MPRERSKDSKKSTAKRKELFAVVFIAIIVFAIAGGLVYGLKQYGTTSISTFESNFDNAPKVAILVTAYNGTALTATVGCATSLIEQLVATHGAAHKNATGIGYYVINQTSCLYSANGLGSATSNYTKTNPQQCIYMTANIPRIFINYSNTNTTVITPTSLQVSGNLRFLIECGVASEITSQ